MTGHNHDRFLLELSLKTHETDWQLINTVYDEAKLFLEGQPSHQQCGQVGETDDEASQACLVFIARTLASGDAKEARKLWPLTKIVATCGTNLYDFFRELPVKASRLSSFLETKGANWQALEAQNHVKEWQKTLISLTLLSKKFKDLVSRFIQNMGIHKQAVLRLGWFLFLNLKAKLLPAFPDLVSCMTLLACVLNILVTHAPKLPDSVMNQLQAHPTVPVDTLQTLCVELKMDMATVTQQMAAVDSLLGHMLPCFVPEWRTEDRSYSASQQVKTHCSHFKGLLTDPARLNLGIEGLEREYMVVYNSHGEIDEREFLFKDFSSMASPRFSPTSFYNAAKRMHMGGGPPALGSAACTKQLTALGPGASMTAAPGGVNQQQGEAARVAPSVPLGLQSPLPIMRLASAGPGSTPVTETMAAASWLKGITEGSMTEPSPQLQLYLHAAGGPAMAAHVAKRAWELVEACLPDVKPSVPLSTMMGFPHVQTSLNTLRKAEAMKLYYIALEGVLAGEQSTADFATRLLLNAVKFHKGLMACCLEMVIASYKMVSCNFPHVLDRLKLKAFDLSKVIQSFVKYLPSLPRELKRHLFVIEERIVESLAWEPGSPLYGLIIQAAAAATTPASAAPGSADLGPSSPKAHLPAPGLALGASAQEDKQGGGVSGQSPKRSHGTSSLSGVRSPSPLKKARTDGSASGNGATPTLLFAEPLPLAVGTLTSPGVLHEFLRKVVKLVSFRLALMIDTYDFSPLDGLSVYNNIMEVLEHAVYHQTHLFYNRHIDQLMLSVLYGYCKVHKLAKVSFREIITQYRRQPQATQQVFRSVNLEQSNPGLIPKGQADIITFYNQCFVPVMKQFLLKKTGHAGEAAGGHGQHLGLPPIPPHPRARRMSSEGMPPQVQPPKPAPPTTSGIRPFFPLISQPQAAPKPKPEPMEPSLKPMFVIGSSPASVALEPTNHVQLHKRSSSLGVIGSRPSSSAGEPTRGGSSAPIRPTFSEPLPAAEPKGQAVCSRPLDKMPSGIAALLQALDSAEGQQDVPQKCRQLACDQAKFASMPQHQHEAPMVQLAQPDTFETMGGAAAGHLHMPSHHDLDLDHASPSSGGSCGTANMD